MKYTENDFIIGGSTDKRILYTFTTKDGYVQANLFWEPDNVEIRGIVGEEGLIHIHYPLMNRHGLGLKPKSEDFIASILLRIKRKEYL